MAQTTLRWFSRSSHRLPICLPTRWAKGRKSSMQGDADNAFLPKAPAFCRLFLCSPVLLFPTVLWETHGSVCWSPSLLPSLFRLQLDWFSADICWEKSEPRRTQGQLALHWTGGMFLSCPLIRPIPGLTHPSLGSLHLSANLLPVIVSIMPLWSLTLNIGFWGAGGIRLQLLWSHDSRFSPMHLSYKIFSFFLNKTIQVSCLQTSGENPQVHVVSTWNSTLFPRPPRMESPHLSPLGTRQRFFLEMSDKYMLGTNESIHSPDPGNHSVSG